MKKITLIGIVAMLGLMGLITLGFAGQADTQTNTQKAASQDRAQPLEPQPLAVFPETVHDFGSVMEAQELKYDFIIENHGPGLLIIDSVRPD